MLVKPPRTSCTGNPRRSTLSSSQGGKTVCRVGLVEQTVEVQANPVSIAGIGGVLVRRECRGRGYCRMAMGAAETFAFGQMRVKFILLFCRPALQSLYEHGVGPRSPALCERSRLGETSCFRLFRWPSVGAPSNGPAGKFAQRRGPGSLWRCESGVGGQLCNGVISEGTNPSTRFVS
jgi:hypothetical protein